MKDLNEYKKVGSTENTDWIGKRSPFHGIDSGRPVDAGSAITTHLKPQTALQVLDPSFLSIFLSGLIYFNILLETKNKKPPRKTFKSCMAGIFCMEGKDTH